MSMSRAPVVCRSPNMVLKRYRGTVTWDVWSSLGGTLMGLGGLGKSMMSPATLFTMDCRGRRRHGRVRAAHPRGFDPASPTQPPPVSNPAPPRPAPAVGKAFRLTLMSSSMYWLEMRGSVARVNSTDPRGPKGTRPAWGEEEGGRPYEPSPPKITGPTSIY